MCIDKKSVLLAENAINKKNNLAVKNTYKASFFDSLLKPLEVINNYSLKRPCASGCGGYIITFERIQYTNVVFSCFHHCL